jgi:hypothetical protein
MENSNDITSNIDVIPHGDITLKSRLTRIQTAAHGNVCRAEHAIFDDR